MLESKYNNSAQSNQLKETGQNIKIFSTLYLIIVSRIHTKNLEFGIKIKVLSIFKVLKLIIGLPTIVTYF